MNPDIVCSVICLCSLDCASDVMWQTRNGILHPQHSKGHKYAKLLETTTPLQLKGAIYLYKVVSETYTFLLEFKV